MISDEGLLFHYEKKIFHFQRLSQEKLTVQIYKTQF